MLLKPFYGFMVSCLGVLICLMSRWLLTLGSEMFEMTLVSGAYTPDKRDITRLARKMADKISQFIVDVTPGLSDWDAYGMIIALPFPPE